uniref:Uncharacterized protein n=1 Tax=viral metagenome TaxID=1070528 RepID=A0A6C0KX80_9ZZZZ|tara:strand:+ start:2239 stop:2625 length:387 start_codon:yes stop_codon:yes gene_type:complete
MELAKLLLKLLYLSFLYVVVYMLVKPQVQISGANLSVAVLTLSILLMYVTFDSIYDYMTTNEIVIQKDTKVEKDEKEKKDKKDKKDAGTGGEGTGHGKTNIVDNVHKEESSNYLFDHTHKFIQDKVFS